MAVYEPWYCYLHNRPKAYCSCSASEPHLMRQGATSNQPPEVIPEESKVEGSAKAPDHTSETDDG